MRMIFLITLFLFAVVVILSGISPDDPLSPSAAAEKNFVYPDLDPKDNIYVGVAGLPWPEDGDVVAAGEKFLRKGDRSSYQDRPSLTVSSDPPYRHPCLEPSAGADCLDSLVSQAAEIKAALAANRVMLERYRDVQKMTGFVNRNEPMAPVPLYNGLIKSTRLIDAQALLDIKQGRVEQGLKAIEKEIDFYQRICHSQYVGLIDLMIAIAGTQINLIALEKVIADESIDLRGQEARLRRMLGLDINIKMAETALRSEKRQFMQISDLLEPQPYFYGPEPDPSQILPKPFKDLFYKDNMTVNEIAAKMDREIEVITQAPLLGFPEYFQRQREIKERQEAERGAYSAPGLKESYHKYGPLFFKNYIGEFMLNVAQPMYLLYAARVNDALLYTRLLRAQLELRLMADRPADAAEALARLGPEFNNPYTGRPFDWDREKNELQADKAANMKDLDDKNNAFRVPVPSGR